MNRFTAICATLLILLSSMSFAVTADATSKMNAGISQKMLHNEMCVEGADVVCSDMQMSDSCNISTAGFQVQLISTIPNHNWDLQQERLSSQFFYLRTYQSIFPPLQSKPPKRYLS